MNYDLKSPCANCPFRNDRPGFLSKGRPKEIADSIRGGAEFACHKTTKFKDGEEGPEHVPHAGEQMCAGALILMVKTGTVNQMARIVYRLGMLNLDALNLKAPVYDTWAEFIKKAVEPKRKGKKED